MRLVRRMPGASARCFRWRGGPSRCGSSRCSSRSAQCLGLHVGAVRLASRFPEQQTALLRLDAPGSLARWLASALLTFAAATCVLLYSLRRHRLDDYHGRYRVWIWAAIACLLASIRETTSAGELARACAARLRHWLNLRATVVWPVTCGVLATAISVRVAVEIRRCWPAATALFASAACIVLATAVQAEWLTLGSAAVAPLVVHGAWLVGYVLIVTMLLLYARRVQLDVIGAVPRPASAKTSKPQPIAPADVSAAPPRQPALRLRTDLDPVEPSAEVEKPRPAAAISPAPVEPNASPQHLKSLSRADANACVAKPVWRPKRRGWPRQSRINIRASRPRGKSSTRKRRGLPIAVPMASAARYPLRTALSIVDGQPVAVQSPATNMPGVGVCWLGRQRSSPAAR